MFVFISINCVIECVHYKLNYVVESHMVRDKNIFFLNYNGLFHESVKTGKDTKEKGQKIQNRHQLSGLSVLSGFNWCKFVLRLTEAPVVLVLQPEWPFSITKVSSSSIRPGRFRVEPLDPSSQGNLSRY